MIDELRTTLSRHAAALTPEPDPYGRLLIRRSRRRQRQAVVAAVLATAVLVSGVWLSGHRAVRNVGPAVAAPKLSALLASPTRGSLAGDAAFLDQMRRRTAADAHGIDPAIVRVLYAGDVVDSQRLVISTWVGSDPTAFVYLGPQGSPAGGLPRYTEQPLQPVVDVNWSAPGSGSDGGTGYGVLVAPAGSRLEVGTDPRYHADGTVTRTWTDRPGDTMVFPVKDNPLRSRVRVSLDARPIYEGPLPTVLAGLSATVDADPVDGGKPVPAASGQVADTLARTTGLSTKDAHYEVLWSDEIPMAGLPNSATAIIATVVALTPEGGGPFATYAFDPTQPDASTRNHPTGSGIMGDPAHWVIAMRLPWYSGTSTTDALQIVAPPTAVRADLLRDGAVVATVPLNRGAGQAHLALPASVTVVAYDSTGAEVARHAFVDNENNIVDLYEPPVEFP
jgi:hypothetical protein